MLRRELIIEGKFLTLNTLQLNYIKFEEDILSFY